MDLEPEHSQSDIMDMPSLETEEEATGRKKTQGKGLKI